MFTNGTQIRVLLVSEAKEARKVRGLLDSNGLTPFYISRVSCLDLAADRVFSDRADVLLLDMCSKRQEARAFIETARATVPDMPIVILSESEDEALAVEALRQGVQDFLDKTHLDRDALARSLRYSIERHRLQKTLRSLSLLDDLTGLNNRRGFLALAEQHMRVILRKGAALLVYLDLDNLKMINDTHGHLEGNRALVGTANILRACFRQSDILARIGGDEFCVLMTDAAESSAKQVRKRLQQGVDFLNAPSSRHFRLSFSIGIAEVPVVHQPSIEELLRVADGLMYEEKRNKQLPRSFSSALKQTTIV